MEGNPLSRLPFFFFVLGLPAHGRIKRRNRKESRMKERTRHWQKSPKYASARFGLAWYLTGARAEIHNGPLGRETGIAVAALNSWHFEDLLPDAPCWKGLLLQSCRGPQNAGCPSRTLLQNGFHSFSRLWRTCLGTVAHKY